MPNLFIAGIIPISMTSSPSLQLFITISSSYCSMGNSLYFFISGTISVIDVSIAIIISFEFSVSYTFRPCVKVVLPIAAAVIQWRMGPVSEKNVRAGRWCSTTLDNALWCFPFCLRQVGNCQSSWSMYHHHGIGCKYCHLFIHAAIMHGSSVFWKQVFWALQFVLQTVALSNTCECDTMGRGFRPE